MRKFYYGIGLFLSVCFLIGGFYLSYRNLPENKNFQAVPADTSSSDRFFLEEEDGMVVVYLIDGHKLYERTGIELKHLPSSLQAEILLGKRIKNEPELYDFLENYSS